MRRFNRAMQHSTREIIKRLPWLCIHLVVCGIGGIVFCQFYLGLSKSLGVPYYLFAPLDWYLRDAKIPTDHFDVVIPLWFAYMAFLGIVVGSAAVWIYSIFAKKKER